MFRVIIAGGRDFNNYELLQTKMDFYLQNQTDVTIVSGMAKGADALGVRYAHSKNLNIAEYPAEWKRKDGSCDKAAGYKRNLKMADNADALVAFWDGHSKGTKHMIDTMLKRNMPVRIVKY